MVRKEIVKTFPLLNFVHYSIYIYMITHNKIIVKIQNKEINVIIKERCRSNLLII